MVEVPEIGSVIAERYEILASAGQTPTRLAFTAFDRDVEVELTLWWVRAGLFEDEMASEIFEHNVRAMRKIKSPHLLKIFDFGQGKLWDGYYLTLQLGSSQEFESMLESPTPVNSDTFLHFARALAAGIEAAYEHGYYHSWLLPTDVVAVGGQVKVSGVGLFAGVPQLQVIGALDGDTRYIAPEILAGGEGSPASDIYTIAVMLLELSIGGDESVSEKSAKLCEQEPERWKAISAGLSEKPNDRPSSATQMISSLELLGTGEQASPKSEPPKRESKGNDTATGQESPESESTFDDYIGGRNLLEDEEQSGDYDLEHPEVGDSEDVFVSEVIAPPVKQAKAVHSDSLSESAIVSELDSVDADDTVINLEPKAKPSASPRTETRGSRNQGAEASELFSGFQEKKKGNGGYWALVVAAIIAGGAALLLSSLQKSTASSDDSSTVVPIDAGALALDSGSAVISPLPVCPVGMLHLAERELCIDAYESPGLGQEPTTGLSLGAAQSDCKDRGVRLCRAEEWEYACRRKGTQSYSYGDRFQAEICNLRSGQLGPAGSKGECHSEAGVYDLNGNAAEWVEEGAIRGGSALDESEGRCSSERANPDRQASYSDVGFRCCADRLASASASD